MSIVPCKIKSSPEIDALHQFDATHNVEPCRTIALRIAQKYDCTAVHPIVDEISQAIEDARELGEKRGPFADAARRS
jgi:hypothetical protein